MAKKINVTVDAEGIHAEFSGFPGKTCFDEAAVFKRELAALGIDTNTIKVVETRTEVETRRLENPQSVVGR